MWICTCCQWQKTNKHPVIISVMRSDVSRCVSQCDICVRVGRVGWRETLLLFLLLTEGLFEIRRDGAGHLVDVKSFSNKTGALHSAQIFSFHFSYLAQTPPSLPPSSPSLSCPVFISLLFLSLPSFLSFSALLPEWQLNTQLSQAYLASADGWLGSLFIRHDLGWW